MRKCFSQLSQNTRELYQCEPKDCEEEELLAILVRLNCVPQVAFSLCKR